MKTEHYFRELDREHERKLEARDRARTPVFNLKCPCCGHRWEQAVPAAAPCCPQCYGPAIVDNVRT